MNDPIILTLIIAGAIIIAAVIIANALRRR